MVSQMWCPRVVELTIRKRFSRTDSSQSIMAGKNKASRFLVLNQSPLHKEVSSVAKNCFWNL